MQELRARWTTDEGRIKQELWHSAISARKRVPPEAHWGTDRFDARGIDLSGADLRGLDLVGLNLQFADIRGSQLDHCAIAHADISHADLSGVRADKLNATGIFAEFTKFVGATLSNCEMGASRLRGADFTNAVISNIELNRSDLYDLKLDGATLIGIRLSTSSTFIDDSIVANFRNAGVQLEFDD